MTCPHTLGPNGIRCTLAAAHPFGHVYEATGGADLSDRRVEE